MLCWICNASQFCLLVYFGDASLMAHKPSKFFSFCYRYNYGWTKACGPAVAVLLLLLLLLLLLQLPWLLPLLLHCCCYCMLLVQVWFKSGSGLVQIWVKFVSGQHLVLCDIYECPAHSTPQACSSLPQTALPTASDRAASLRIRPVVGDNCISSMSPDAACRAVGAPGGCRGRAVNGSWRSSGSTGSDVGAAA